MPRLDVSPQLSHDSLPKFPRSPRLLDGTLLLQKKKKVKLSGETLILNYVCDAIYSGLWPRTICYSFVELHSSRPQYASRKLNQTSRTCHLVVLVGIVHFVPSAFLCGRCVDNGQKSLLEGRIRGQTCGKQQPKFIFRNSSCVWDSKGMHLPSIFCNRLSSSGLRGAGTYSCWHWGER